MPGESDIFFDQGEFELMFNRELFPLKRRINQKLYTLFEQVKNRIKDTSIHSEFPFPEGTDISTGKISQGENHQQYPWVTLDFPKLFQPLRIFSFRTMFWFGSGFSNSIVVGGNCCDIFIEKLLANKSALHERKIYFSTAEDPWDHDIDGDGSVLMENMYTDAILSHVQKNNFFKLSNKFKLNSGEKIAEKTVENYKLMLQVLS